MRLPPARATVGICGVTALAWGVVAAAGLTARVAVLAGFVPARLSGMATLSGAVPAALTPFTATLVHAGLLHLAFNLLMLGFCGRFVEASIGPGAVLLLYGIGAYAAAGAEYLVSPLATVPMIGASGAASAVIGAYALLFGQRRARGWGPRSSLALHVLWLAAAWIVLQALIGLASGALVGGAGIAVAGHVGGFLAGLVLARPLLLFRYRNA